MCRNNEYGGRRCPVTPKVRSEQNHKYYLKRKAAGTTGTKLVKHAPVVDAKYSMIPNVHELENFIHTIGKESFVDLYSLGKPWNYPETDEVWETFKEYAKRIGEGFDTTFTIPDGYPLKCETSNVRFVKDEKNLSRIRISGRVMFGDAMAGHWERSITYREGVEPFMQYEQLTVNDEFHGKKIGTQLIKHFDAATKATGINTVKTFANSDIGGYAWAKAGYDWDKETTSYDGHLVNYFTFEQRFNDWSVNTAVADGGAAERHELNTMVKRLSEDTRNPNYPTPYEVAMCGKTFMNGDGLWAGKQILLNSGWDGVRTL